MIRKFARALVPKKWHVSQRLEADIVDRAGGSVVSGLFAGMRYVTQSSGSVWLPKLLGTYEHELQTYLSPLLERPFDSILVAGAAEGYYAVGFALRSRAPRVYAFEPNARARALLADLATKNNVADKIVVDAICDLSHLKRCLAAHPNTLVFVDIEGGEALLLDPEVVPELRGATIIVEVHEMAVPGVGALLRKRFFSTHNIDEPKTQVRRAEDSPRLNGEVVWTNSTRGAMEQLLSERRGCDMSWLVMIPKLAQ